MFDTNVWLDYHCARDGEDKTAHTLLDTLLSRSHQLYVTPMILKDVYYLIGSILKQEFRVSEQSVSTGTAGAINEIAWGCVRQMLAVAEVAGVGPQNCVQAVSLRTVHEDFEDNLILACAQASSIDYFITSDKRLLKHAAITCISPKEMLSIMKP
ncbi:MAG: PIN domain-containing protein [Raoultibacter sp.]